MVVTFLGSIVGESGDRDPAFSLHDDPFLFCYDFLFHVLSDLHAVIRMYQASDPISTL